MNKVKIYVVLLEEGTPTLRGTEAEELGDGLYRILPTPDYDPNDEIWEFVSGDVVTAIQTKIDKDEFGLLARRPFMTRSDILAQHPRASLIKIAVMTQSGGVDYATQTEAVDLGNSFFKLLPSSNYDPLAHIWEFTPGSVVRAIHRKNGDGRDILLAFDQIREDRMNEDYATYVRELDRSI